MQIHLDTDQGYIRAIASGPFSLEDGKRTFLELLDFIAERKIGRILFDGRQVSGEPNVLERLLYGEFTAQAVAEFCKRTRFPAPQFAYVLVPPVLDPNRSGEDKAVEGGMDVKAFDNVEAALRWLGLDPNAFPTHGKAHYVITGQIVRLRVEGPWNEQLVVEIHAALHKSLQGFPHKSWGLLVAVRKSALCSFEALKAIRAAAVEETAASGRIATAWVLPEGIEGGDMMSNALRGIYAEVTPFRVFAAEAEAERWLTDRLAASPG